MEHARYRVKSSEGHSQRWLNMSVCLKEGCPAASIEFSIYHSFTMIDLKSRLSGYLDGRVQVGFSSEEFNELPLVRDHLPAKKVTGMNKITNTARPVDLLLIADDTTSLCRRSHMQQFKELMKQTFDDWKLTLNDDTWEHIICEADPEARKLQRKKIDRSAGMLGAHGTALGTFHHDQKQRLMAAMQHIAEIAKLGTV